MAAASHREDAPGEYSTLEALDPQRPPLHLEDSGLQNTHLYGDHTLNGKEVVKTDGLEVLQDPKHTADVENAIATARRSWKRRKICGIPILVLGAAALVLFVGAVVGGAVGGTRGKKNARPPTRTEVFELPKEGEFYHIVNDFNHGNESLRYLSANDGKVVVEETADEPAQQWQFHVVGNATVDNSTRPGPDGPHFQITNAADGIYSPPLLGVYPNTSATNAGQLRFQSPDENGAAMRWYWQGNWARDGSTELALANEEFTDNAANVNWVVMWKDSAPVGLESFAAKSPFRRGALWYLQTATQSVFQPDVMATPLSRLAGPSLALSDDSVASTRFTGGGFATTSGTMATSSAATSVISASRVVKISATATQTG